MLSLYLHIPFCQEKCKYCAFATFPLQDKQDTVAPYLNALKAEIDFYTNYLGSEPLKTIYFGWGTPNLLGAEKIIEILDYIAVRFSCEDLVELSFEFNPYPEEEIYEIIRKVQARYAKKYPRIRFSFGIQSFDNEVLQLSGRKTLFLWLVDFLRGLQVLKTDTTVFNFDFIAFGKRNQSKKGNRYLRNQLALDFFENFVHSGFADSFSLYTLELFENQMRKRKNADKLISGEYFGTDDDIYEEFTLLKSILLSAGYARYELSNFAHAGKSSIHNRVYREMENYLGLWLNSASFLNENLLSDGICDALGRKKTWERGIRFKNTRNFDHYLNGQRIDQAAFESLNEKDYLIEEFFLGLRTDRGVSDLQKYEKILVANADLKRKMYHQQGFILPKGNGLVLTDQGMDVFNAIVTDILAEI